MLRKFDRRFCFITSHEILIHLVFILYTLWPKVKNDVVVLLSSSWMFIDIYWLWAQHHNLLLLIMTCHGWAGCTTTLLAVVCQNMYDILECAGVIHDVPCPPYRNCIFQSSDAPHKTNGRYFILTLTNSYERTTRATNGSKSIWLRRCTQIK